MCYLSFLHHVLLDLIKNYTYFNIYQIFYFLFKLHIITLTFPFLYLCKTYIYLFYDICYNIIHYLLFFTFIDLKNIGILLVLKFEHNELIHFIRFNRKLL